VIEDPRRLFAQGRELPSGAERRIAAESNDRASNSRASLTGSLSFSALQALNNLSGDKARCKWTVAEISASSCIPQRATDEHELESSERGRLDLPEAKS